MRVGINGRFYAAPITGVQQFARGLTKQLCRRTDVVVLLPRNANAGDLPTGTLVIRGKLSGRAWETLELPMLARAHGCDVLLNPGGSAPLFGRRQVVVVHDLLPLTHPAFYTRAFRLWYRMALLQTARRADVVIAVSDHVKQEIELRLGVVAARVRVIAQGIEPFTQPATQDDVDSVRRDYGIPRNYVLATGGGDPRKNISFLIDVMNRWRANARNAPTLVIVGPRLAHVHTRTKVRASEHIRFIGHVSDLTLHALFTGARVFCFPSLAEGFGRPPLEALACGTPAIVGDYEGASEVLGDSAVILPLDVDQWLEALMRLHGDPKERQRYVTRGQAISETYRWNRAVLDVLDACRAAYGNKIATGVAAL